MCVCVYIYVYVHMYVCRFTVSALQSMSLSEFVCVLPQAHMLSILFIQSVYLHVFACVCIFMCAQSHTTWACEYMNVWFYMCVCGMCVCVRESV